MLARILLHFHPDWPFGEMTVMDAVAASGRYLSQFRTGTSNGGLTAHRGGDRWRNLRARSATVSFVERMKCD